MRMENLFIQILQRSQAPPLASSRNSKAGKRVGKRYHRKKGRLYVCPNWRLLA